MCGLRCDVLWCCDAASWYCDVLRCCGAASWCCDVLRCCIVVLRRVMVLRCCIVMLRRVTVLRCCIVMLRCCIVMLRCCIVMLRRVALLRCCIVVLRRVMVLRYCIVVLRRVTLLRCCIMALRRVMVLRCILLLFLPFPVLLFLFSFPHLVLVPRYGEITMKAFRPSPFTGDMHTERRIFGIASRCGTFGTRHTEMVLSARQAFQPPHIVCMFFARHIQLCFRLSQVARPLGRGGASAGRGTPQYERSPVSGLYVS